MRGTKMRKKLIELLRTVPRLTFVSGRSSGKTNMTMEHIADHLLENGALVPPVAVGGGSVLSDDI